MTTVRSGHPIENDFEADLRELFRERVRSDERLRTCLYASLCNVEWQRDGVGFAMTWQDASSLVGQLAGGAHDLDLYCSGGGGTVDPEVATALGERGWTPETDQMNWLGVPWSGKSDSS